jgi:ubiquinone/menaquinone biosynthesis C-methylase UbiE
MKYKQSNGKVLYFAPEKPLEKKLRESRDVITADLNSKEVDIKANIQNLPFDDSAFDLIICSHVLEHVKHDELAIKEIGRVLSETGDALIMIPKDKDMESTYEDFSITSEEDMKKEFGQENHVRKYGNDFEDIIQNEDLDVKTKTYSKKFSSDRIDRLGLKTYNSDGSFKKYPDIHHCTI